MPLVLLSTMWLFRLFVLSWSSFDVDTMLILYSLVLTRMVARGSTLFCPTQIFPLKKEEKPVISTMFVNFCSVYGLQKSIVWFWCLSFTFFFIYSPHNTSKFVPGDQLMLLQMVKVCSTVISVFRASCSQNRPCKVHGVLFECFFFY